MTNDANLPARSDQGAPTSPTAQLANLDPFQKLDRRARELAPILDRLHFPCMPGTRPDDSPTQIAANREHCLKELSWFLNERCPSLAAVAGADAIEEALQQPPNKRVTRTALAVLLDTRTRLPLNPSLYVDACTYDLMELGFPPVVVVAACQHLRREATFTPEIAEIVAACREAQTRLLAFNGTADRAFDIITRAQDMKKRLEAEACAASSEAAPANAETRPAEEREPA